MVKENGMVMMNETEFNEMSERLAYLEAQAKELRQALLVATRNKEGSDSGDICLKRQTFLDVYNRCFNREDEDIDPDIYGHDVSVHWHGLWCNCGDGATACNNIIYGIEGCIDEDDGDY